MTYKAKNGVYQYTWHNLSTSPPLLQFKGFQGRLQTCSDNFEQRNLLQSTDFHPREAQRKHLFCNSFSTILKVVVSNKKPLDQIFKNLLGKRTFVPPKPGGMSATFSVSFLLASWPGCCSLLTGMKTNEDWFV